jgi:hypothetical protein
MFAEHLRQGDLVSTGLGFMEPVSVRQIHHCPLQSSKGWYWPAHMVWNVSRFRAMRLRLDPSKGWF